MKENDNMKDIDLIKLIVNSCKTIFILFFYILLLPRLLGVLNNYLPINNGIILSIIDYSIIFIIITLLFYKDYYTKFKNYFKNLKYNLNENTKYYVYGFIGMVLFNIIISLILPNTIPVNESINRQVFKQYPLLFLFEAVLVGPICEELVFRSNFKFIKSNILFIIGTSCIFSLTHVLNGITKISELLYFFPYLSLGIAFAYIYRKSNNIHDSIIFHILHNGITVIILLLSM